MVSRSLNDPYSPGKVDKFEAIEIKEKLTGKGADVSEAAKAFIADQVQAGKFDAGGAAVMQDLFSQPTQSYHEKVTQQADVAIKSLHQALDFGFIGGVNNDGSVTGSENAGDVAGMAEKYLSKLNELAGESSNLRNIVTATLDGGKLIKDPEKRLNSYLKTLNLIKTTHKNNDRDMKHLASDAIQNVHTAVRSLGGQIMSNGSINNLSREGIYSGAYNQLNNIENKASNEFIRNQAANGLTAARNATNSSYQSATNIILETLRNIAGGTQVHASPKAPGGGDLTVETTVTTKIKQ